jgi:hypothetical protein
LSHTDDIIKIQKFTARGALEDKMSDITKISDYSDANVAKPTGPKLPEFRYPKWTVILPILFASIGALVIGSFLIVLFGMEAIQNEDEAAALRALIISGVGAIVSATVIGLLAAKKFRRNVREGYEENCKKLIADYEAKLAEESRLAEERATKAEAEAEGYKLYNVCEFCGEHYEHSDKRGETHNSSYSDGYNLEVTSSTTGVIRENRVDYRITECKETYRCPCCKYSIDIKYELFNGLIRTNTDIFVYHHDSTVPPERIKEGRLYKSFKISNSRQKLY